MTCEAVMTNRHFNDLNPILAGSQKCKPGHSYGPAVRNYVLIHFVTGGSGLLFKNGTEYKIHAGEAFIINPSEVTVYKASLSDPWSYAWIGFEGQLAKDFAKLSPVVKYSENWAQKIIDVYHPEKATEYTVAGILFDMYRSAFFSDKESGRTSYVESACDYIKALYMQKITVEGIAESINLNRRYLSRLFKAEKGITIQDYLIDVRMDEAKKKLKEGISVSDSAQLCGYGDVCNFSKMFKRKYGISPAEWKNSQINS